MVQGPGIVAFYLNYDMDRYQDIIETLRYEKPVYVFIMLDTGNVITTGWVSTSREEPVGEQEGQGAPYTPT